MKLIKLRIVTSKFVLSQVYCLFQLYIPMNGQDVIGFGNSIRQILLGELLRNYIKYIWLFISGIIYYRN
jgi:thiamine transporter ThiT